MLKTVRQCRSCRVELQPTSTRSRLIREGSAYDHVTLIGATWVSRKIVIQRDDELIALRTGWRQGSDGRVHGRDREGRRQGQEHGLLHDQHVAEA